MATKLAFGEGQVNISQRVEPKTGEMKRTDRPVQVKTTVIRPASVRPTED